MKKSFIVTLVFCFALSFNTDAEVKSGAKECVNRPASNNSFPNILRPIGNLFKRLFGKREEIICYVPGVSDIQLSQTSITSYCSTNNSCAESNQKVEVITMHANPNREFLTYAYKTSGGKIIGTGVRVTWDLSGVKPGIYSITAAVDDGCGYCGPTKTKTVNVEECLDCSTENTPQ